MIPSMLIASCLLGVDPGVAERGIRKTGTDRSTDYSEKWALIVGVGDYTGKAKLKNPVNDAEAMRGILEKYGFKNKDRVAVLTDKAATHQAVSAALDKLCHKDKVNSNACVLVFFAGHGSAEAKDTSLLLYDTTYATDGSPVEKLRLADLRKKLIDDCPAKHKLLILDCCHAGNVFRLDGEAYDPLNPIPAEGTFETAKVTQAIVSTWANQQAADADRTNPNNSPFTGSLVAALDSIPRDLPKSDDPLKSHYHFTTSKLFATLQSRLLENRSTAGQTAVCMSLDRQRQGEFHFFPDRDAKFTERFDKETLLLAMTPTTFGNWWADEVPWFMPGLRNEILTRPPSTRSTLVNQLGRKQLIAAAQEVMAEMMKSEDETKKCRAKHLELLLGSGQVGSRHQAIHEVIAQLRTIVGRSKLPDPLDLHYLAVLEHKQGHKLEAAANYTAALERYAELIEKDKKAKSAAPPAETNTPSREKASPHRTLYALCLADQATFFLLVANDYVKAAKGFNSAWEVYAEYAPAPFKVYTRLKEAEAYRRLGFTGLTADRLRAAEDAISTADADWETPLAAATLKNSAWADMEQWNFKAARDKFEEGRARLLRLGKLDPQDEYAIDELHIEHGLAMIERFQGESEKSLRRYRELTAKIVQKIEDLDRRRVQSNYVEIRYLLYARLVNSLQRQADCSLFAPTPDYAEAADDYRRALLQVGNMDDDVREGEKVRLLYCRAIALAARSPTQDLDRARHMFADAEAIVIDKKMKVLPVQVEICRSIAHTLLGLEKTQEATVAVPGAGSSSAKDPVGFKIKCAELSRDSRTFDRDELERMMFGYRLLIEAQIAALSRGTSKVASRTALEEAEASKERHELLGLIDDLLRFCRQVCRASTPDPDTLAFLRPYYELAFLGKLAASPKMVGPATEVGSALRAHPHTKELIEIAFEATHGVPYEKPSGQEPILSLFCCRDRGYFLLDAPRMGGRCYVSDLDPALLRTEARADKKLPPLPLDLLSDLRVLEIEFARKGEPNSVDEMAKKAEMKLKLRWADSYHRIGYDYDTHNVQKPSAEPVAPVALYRLEPRLFPFDLKWAIDPDRCTRCDREQRFQRHVPNLPFTVTIK